MCPARRRAWRTSALLEVAMQSAFQEKCSYTMAVRGLLGEGSVTVHRMRAFAVANEMGQGCSIIEAIPATFSRKETMQPTRKAPQGSVPPTGQGGGPLWFPTPSHCSCTFLFEPLQIGFLCSAVDLFYQKPECSRKISVHSKECLDFFS